ncbi:MAG: BMP family ABC transporter substrate-binding protein [Firmicutes bacterium HGW-Firmicutes-2]|jgi:ribose transport system substrate-binding protein|nr:MAG: BMP family ABC transporter substrate-binding protein [Firmicutes bacterium HGW-Firmicutes-2]
MKKVMSMVMVMLLLTVLFSGCGKEEQTTSAGDVSGGSTEQTEVATGDTTPDTGKDEPLYIPIISKGFQHQFWQAVKNGAEQAAYEYGVTITFEGPETEAMVDKQIEMVEAALSKNPSAICLAALDSKALIPLIERATAAGIPVIGFDSGVDSELIAATAATDNYAASMYAADKMAELIGEKGKVGMIVHDQTSKTGVDRRDGFKDRMEDKYPNIEIVDIQYGDGDQLKSTEIAKAILTANPELDGFFGSNEGSIIGVLNAIREVGLEGKIIAVGYDSGKAQMDAVREGIISGSISQDPIGIGYKAVEAAVKAARGETLEKNIDTGFVWYDASNINDEDVFPVLYE